MFHSPKNRIGIKYSANLEEWKDTKELLTFGQSEWELAKGRLTAGAVIKLGEEKKPLYLMLFHGSGQYDKSVIFDTHACIGIAWRYDFKHCIWK